MSRARRLPRSWERPPRRPAPWRRSRPPPRHLGNVAACTLTIEQTGGSGIVVPHRGFLLDDELTDFSFAPADPAVHDPNLPGPGERPRSSISPAVVLRHGRPVVAHRSSRRRLVTGRHTAGNTAGRCVPSVCRLCGAPRGIVDGPRRDD